MSLQIDHGLMSNQRIIVDGNSRNAFIYLKMINMRMFDVRFEQAFDLNDFNLGLHVDNSTWVNSCPFIELSNIISISIVSSQLTSKFFTCTLIDVKGVWEIYFDAPLVWYFLKSINPSHTVNYSIVTMIDTTFKTQSSPRDKITTDNTITALINSTFMVEQIMQFSVGYYLEVQNVLLQCATGDNAEKTFDEFNRSILFSCNPVCERGSKYSLEAGKLIITNGLFESDEPSVWLSEAVDPSCQSCPLGAKCEGGIQVVPNYWGYRDTETSVSMVRCPEGYCCQGNETCNGIDSCNTGRTGTLCGKCQENLTESIFTPQCLPLRSCRSGLVASLFTSTALIYATTLLSFSAIKSKMTKLVKKFYTICKGKFKKDNVKTGSINKDQPTDHPNTEDIDSKYVQILLYVMPTRRLEVNVSTVRFTITRASITEARRCYNYKTQSPPLPKGGGGARAI